jgi:transcription initiation factor TFIID subunit 13
MAQNSEVAATKVTRVKKHKQGKFHSDIEEMMFGFGDDWPPNSDAVGVVESLVVSYIEDLAVRALEVAELR